MGSTWQRINGFQMLVKCSFCHNHPRDLEVLSCGHMLCYGCLTKCNFHCPVRRENTPLCNTLSLWLADTKKRKRKSTSEYMIERNRYAKKRKIHQMKLLFVLQGIMVIRPLISGQSAVSICVSCVWMTTP